jgi:hypothetical protein
MSVFVLPIKHNYIPSWGVWEAVRETMQNGLDEQDQYGHELVVTHKENILSVKNIGANLDTKALLLGHTTKSGTDLRGQHGEGLNLAMLAAVRAGRKMRIETPDEIWNPSIDYSTEYKERVLHVTTRKRRKLSDCVEVFLDVTLQEWELFKNNFLPLIRIEEELLIKTLSGSVILEDSFQGKIFVKGIFVEKDPELKYGYDLKNVSLDRDRRVLSTFDKRWEIQSIFDHAAARAPQKISKLVFDLLQNDWEDSRGMTNYSSAALKKGVAEHFKAAHGEAAVPVQSIGDSAEMGHFGKVGIVVPQALKGVLDNTDVQSVKQVKDSFAKAVKKTYSFSELDENEKQVLLKIEETIKRIYKFIPSSAELIEDFSQEYGISYRTSAAFPDGILGDIEIVDLFDKKTRGLCDLVSGKISISKDILKSYYTTLRVIVHELAHKLDGSSDGYKGHVSTMEELWSLLYSFKSTK